MPQKRIKTSAVVRKAIALADQQLDEKKVRITVSDVVRLARLEAETLKGREDRKIELCWMSKPWNSPPDLPKVIR